MIKGKIIFVALMLLFSVNCIFAFRYYDPQIARWMAVDPADQFYSPYTYCHNDPINFIDPDGCEEKPDGFIGPLNQDDWYSSQELASWDSPEYFSFRLSLNLFLQNNPSRVDADGYMTFQEGISWLKSGEGKVYLDASQYNFGSTSVSKDFNSTENFKTRINFVYKFGPIERLTNSSAKDTWYIFGRNYSTLISSQNRTIRLGTDNFDYNYGGNISRNIGIYFERTRLGIQGDPTFQIVPYNYGRINP